MIWKYHTIAEKYGLFVLEDAAHAVENSLNKKEEYLNHAVAFSFMLIKYYISWRRWSFSN